MNIGSLFSGAGGLDMAVQQVFGGRTVWHCEVDPAASKGLAHRWPDVPNLGDITKVDWAQVEPIDVLCGGFPCQDVSAAGRRAGIREGTRSGLWARFADAIDHLRPRFVVIENVRGLLNATAHRAMEPGNPTVGDGSGGPVLRAAGAVLGDLADLGYDAQWSTVSAAGVGAPHRRERVFILAHTEGQRWHERRPQPEGEQGRPDAAFGGNGSIELLPTPAACNPNDGETPETWLKRRAEVKARVGNGNGMGMPLSIAVQLLPTPTTQDGANCGGPAQFQRNTLPLNAVAALLQTPSVADSVGGHISRSGDRGSEMLLPGQAREMAGQRWGRYEPAIQRWEMVTRPAPPPTELTSRGTHRLAPAFSEWMMGWPAGWVTQVPGISRNDQLRIIGNGVVPQQAVAALSWLLSVSEVAA